jgi:hypothetical protein
MTNAKRADHARRGQVQIDFHCQCFTAEVVDDVECPEPAAIPQRVRHEVDGPAPVDCLAGYERHRMSRRHPLPAASAAVQLHLAIHAPHPLVIPRQAAATDDLEQLIEAAFGESLSQFR